jgi:hypothetical protein
MEQSKQAQIEDNLAYFINMFEHYKEDIISVLEVSKDRL